MKKHTKQRDRIEVIIPGCLVREKVGQRFDFQSQMCVTCETVSLVKLESQVKLVSLGRLASLGSEPNKTIEPTGACDL